MPPKMEANSSSKMAGPRPESTGLELGFGDSYSSRKPS